jgi:hypothetical protein
MNIESTADFDARMMADTLWLRAEFFRLVPCLAAEEIAALFARPSKEVQATVNKWHAEDRIFHVKRGQNKLYPAFQFGRDLQPLAIVGEILKILRQAPSRSEWDNALWFIAANGWLDGASPLDMLFTEQALVKDAAEQEVLPDIE